MFHSRKQNIILFISFVFVFSVTLIPKTQAYWVSCDSWNCAPTANFEQFGTMCEHGNQAIDCPNGGACTGSINIDCYGAWSCPEATIQCFEPEPTPDPGYGGCTDSNAYNFDPGASWNNGSCLYPTYGCTDPSASNFAGYPPSVVDNGSCVYFVNLNFIVNEAGRGGLPNATVNISRDFGNGTSRTTDGNGFANFGVYANTDIGYSVSASGCNSTGGSVYSGWGATVTVDLWCTPPVYGCTDPNATNYNPAANINDGSCSYCAANMGSGCSSSPNACGQVSSGTIQCNGSCNAGSTPPNPPGYGSGCSSTPNGCGQTNPGVIQCDGSCSASPPSNSSCPAPTTSSVSVTVPDYCTTGPSATIGWAYSDPSGSPQGAYQVQIDNSAGFGNPDFDSGKISCQGCRSYYGGLGILDFNTTYRARVRTWNSFDIVSPWVNASSCSGEGCGGSSQWHTPSHAYPNPNSPYQFTWTPKNPSINKTIPFTDNTSFSGSSVNKQWLWTFVPNGGGSGSSTAQNPTYSFNAEGVYQVTEQVRDNAVPSGAYCIGPTQSISVQKPIPIWKEIAPR